MAGNIRIGAGIETPAQSRTSVSGGFSLPARPAPAPQVPAGYQLMYQMGGPRYMYGETPFYGARYADGGTVPGQIYGNMRGSREGADMFGFFPTMFQSQPYATASQMYTPSLGVMPLIGYPSKYPHVIMGGYSDYGAPIANQAMNMMLPLLMMGLYRQMFPMMPQAPAAAGASGGKKGSGGGSGGGSASKSGGDTAGVSQEEIKKAVQDTNLNLFDIGMAGLGRGTALAQDFNTPLWSAVNKRVTPQNLPPYVTRDVKTGAYSVDPSRASKEINPGLAPKSGADAQLLRDHLVRLYKRPPVQAAATAGGGAVAAPVRTYDDIIRTNPNLYGGD